MQLTRGVWQMSLAMIISGSIGAFVLLSGLPVMDVVFWRCLIGALTLLVFIVLSGQPFSRLTRFTLALAVIGGAALVVNWLLLFASYSRASIAIGTAVYNVQPFMLVGLAAVFLGEKITAAKVTWLSVAFMGMLAIVSAHGAGQTGGSEYLLGIALALGAAFLYAIAALIIKRLAGIPPHLIALIQVATGVLLLAPWVKLGGLPGESSALASLVTLGMVHTGLMYVLLYSAIQRLPTALTGALSFVYPIAAILVDWVAFGHRLAPLQWLGVALILLAAAGMQQGWWFRSHAVVTKGQ